VIYPNICSHDLESWRGFLSYFSFFDIQSPALAEGITVGVCGLRLTTTDSFCTLARMYSPSSNSVGLKRGLAGCFFVAADLVNPPPFEYEDVHIRYKRFVLPHLEMLLLMGCGLAKSAATEIRSKGNQIRYIPNSNSLYSELKFPIYRV